MKASIYNSLPLASLIVGPDAARHMKHYLDNSGDTLTINLEGMIKDVPSARERYEDEVAQAQDFAESLGNGRQFITSRQSEIGYNEQAENRNWYFAIGGYSSWGRGEVVVKADGNTRTFEMTFDYGFFDRYNWDKGKSVTLGGITVTDHFMGEFHRQGLAKEFDCVGSVQRRFFWKEGGSIPNAQLHSPATGSRR